MKAIVTGGAGFIGSHLVERLIHDGHEVLVLDNLSTGSLNNLRGAQHHPRFRFEEADIADSGTISEYFKNVDWVFHLAALSTLVASVDDPLAYFRSNVQGTALVLEASRKAGVKKFVYTASSSCYGIPDEYPTKETAPIRTEYPYALTKHLGELLALHYAKVYKLPVVSLRPFNVYGLRVRTDSTYGAVLGVFLAQKVNHKPFTIVGDGTQTRDFVFVTDVADAFVKAAQSNISGEVFNVGAGNPQSVLTLIDLLGKGEVVFLPKRPGEPQQTYADITKIKNMLGWHPQVSFAEGIKIILEHISLWKDAPVWTKDKIDAATKSWFKYLS